MNSFAHKKKENISTTTIHSSKSKNQPPYSLLIPYGTIPKYNKDKKRNKKAIVSQKQDHSQEPSSMLAPYPFFQRALQSRPSFLTSLAHKWYMNPACIKKNTKPINENLATVSPVGFMPPTTPDTAYLSSVKVTAPMTIHNHNRRQQDVTRNFSSIDSCWNNNNNNDNRDAKETHYPTSSHYYKTASTLSGLLCENYVQSQLMLMMEEDTSEEEEDGCPSLTPTSTSSTTSSSESFFLDTPSSSSSDNGLFDTTLTDPSPETTLNNNNNNEIPIHVPLATFRMFRALDDDTSVWNENMPPCNDTMTKHLGSYDDDHNGKEAAALLENSWANWEKTWQGKQWVAEQKDDCLPLKAPPPPPPSPTAASPPPPSIKSREPRVNSAHLRMLVAEVNMMRADKIVGPLRPRNYLPKRIDPLPHHPRSPLSFSMIIA